VFSLFEFEGSRFQTRIVVDFCRVFGKFNHVRRFALRLRLDINLAERIYSSAED
jgi:hypothetical protein